MPEPEVAVSLRTDGTSGPARAHVLRNVVAISVRPRFTPADAAMLKLVPTTPYPLPPPTGNPVVRRTKTPGRRNTIRSGLLTEETRELFKRLGETEQRVIDGSVMLRWDLGEGDGMIVARMSSDESRSGETIGGQIDAAMKYCDASGNRPRIVLAVLNLSGRTHFDGRHDFGEVFEARRRGEASWVVYRGIDRIARSLTWTTLFVHHLREFEMGLHVAQLHSAIDLDNPFALSQIWALAQAAEIAWASTTLSMQTALSRQLRDAGKGWSNTGGFGFTRDDRGFVTVDPREWGVVLLVHEMYDSCGSIPALRQELENDGIRLSQGVVHKILRDERFLTGRIPTKEGDGQRWDTVHLENPVPQHLWDHNQMLLSDRTGKKTKTPMGRLVLRGIPVYHARCMNHENPAQSDYVLTSRFEQKSKFIVRHAPTTPECCPGYRIDADVLERAVMRGLREALAQDDTLHRAIALGRTGKEPLADRGVFTTQERAGLELEAGRLETYRDGLWQRHLDAVREGRTPDRSFLEAELEHVDADLAATNRQLAIDEQLRGRPRTPQPLPASIVDMLTDEPPDDPEIRLRRKAIVHELVSSVIVHDTDDGLSIELIGPLVPPDSDPGAWTPEQAVDELTEPRLRPLPAVPQPFRYRPKPERLVPVYRSRCDLADEFASETFTCERFTAAIRIAATRDPTGPLFGGRGIGAQRWRAVAAERGLPAEPGHVFKTAREMDTTPTALIREALGAREAVTKGRVRVQSRADAVWVLTEAINDGFTFDDGWPSRARAFAAARPYPLEHQTVVGWSRRHGDGTTVDLVRAAQVLVAAELERRDGTRRRALRGATTDSSRSSESPRK
ncbi:MAG: recombinase family protein [Solirubrobacteraceae bacterium]